MNVTLCGHAATLSVDKRGVPYLMYHIYGVEVFCRFDKGLWRHHRPRPRKLRPMRDDELAMYVLEYGKVSDFPFGDCDIPF